MKRIAVTTAIALCLLLIWTITISHASEMTKEEILTILKEIDDALRIHDVEMVMSYYAEDSVVDCPPFEPYPGEEDRAFLEWLFETYPTFSIANDHYLASGSEKVGIAEHSSIYVVNGVPIDVPHICAMDFEEGKMKLYVVYLDYAAEQIQSGAMPSHNVGDMIPSFPLPASEPTGLAPMEASAELAARMNSHDLSSVAKMLRNDVNVWFPFIDRTAIRSEFIGIHEQMLGGFPDMSWENVRRVDMDDGWVYSELILKGTNDGEFLSKSATGLPMEVRAGLIEHYDEDGLADYVHFHFDTLSVPGQAMPVDEVKEQMLASMMELEDGYNTHDSEKCASFFTEDVIVDMPPVPPYPGGGTAGFDAIWEMWPNFSLGNPIHLASSSDKVGVTEHSDLYSHPDTGAPIETPHICVKDYNDELKAYKLTIYGDFWADELIQAGLMPPRKLGDMIPSFALPEPEATGMSPMEASAELMARLNSGDLISAAKMISNDVDVLFPFINREASRSEFIDIYEQILGGFSDAHWETIRRVDMGDGWVYFEGALKGTNDGDFLGKPATGLPVEVRGGWVERYDENGLATYLHAHFDSLSMPGQEAPTDTEDFSNVFFVDLTAGLNMISLPLKPQTPYTARSLAEEIGATVVIKYDEDLGRFVGFTSGSPGDGFPIEGGKGYIVNVLEGKTHTFAGAAWTNEPSAEAAPPASMSSAWAFVVSGSLVGSRDGDYSVTVKNLRTGDTFTGSVSSGYFAAAYADLSRRPVIEVGDRIEVAVLDSSGELVSGPYIHEVTLEGIRNAAVNVRLRMGHIIPEKSALLQNYPNPFNPETWIPFHLKNEASVSVRIYSINGQLIRTLDVGYRDAGIYVSRSDAAYWDGKNESGEEVASGIYYYTVDAGDFYATRKMIVRK